MKQRRGDEDNWQGESESPGLRRLRRVLSVIALVTSAVISYLAGLVRNWVEIGLLTQLLQAEPHHAINKRLQLLRQLGGAEVEVPVRHYNNHGQMQHLGVELKKTKALGSQAVLEALLGVHLHLQQHHRLLGCFALTATWPEDAIKTVIHRF